MSPILPIVGVLQEHDNDCGAACAMAVGRYLRVGPLTLAEWRQLVGVTPDGTHPNSIAAAFRNLGISAIPCHEMTTTDLRACITRGEPVIALIQANSADTDDAGHYVVVVGVDDNSVRILDPLVNVQPIAMPQGSFANRWHDCGSDGGQYIQFGIVIRLPIPLLPIPLLSIPLQH